MACWSSCTISPWSTCRARPTALRFQNWHCLPSFRCVPAARMACGSPLPTRRREAALSRSHSQWHSLASSALAPSDSGAVLGGVEWGHKCRGVGLVPLTHQGLSRGGVKLSGLRGVGEDAGQARAQEALASLVQTRLRLPPGSAGGGGCPPSLKPLLGPPWGSICSQPSCFPSPGGAGCRLSLCGPVGGVSPTNQACLVSGG